MSKSHWVLPCIAILSCSAGSPGSGDSGSGLGASTDSPGAGGAAANTGATSALGGSLQLGGPGTAGGSGGEMSCASESQEARALPTDLLILLDQSGSMTLEGDRWDPTTLALKTFITNPKSSGLGVGLQYFPLGASKTEDPAICVPANYVTPDVRIATLPANAPPLTGSIDAHHFTAAEGDNATHWGTPTLPAVEGALQYLETYQAANPERAVYLLLATDGKPSKLCPGNDIDGIAAVIAAAAAKTPPIRTFVIGIGLIDRLTALAEAGGTGQSAFIVEAGGSATQEEFSAALNAIRNVALPCDFTIPPPTTGTIDPALVNVEFNGDAAKSVFPKVAGAAACVAGEQNWYYDDENAPTKVVMCPAACDTLKVGNGRIDILFGCKTVVR